MSYHLDASPSSRSGFGDQNIRHNSGGHHGQESDAGAGRTLRAVRPQKGSRASPGYHGQGIGQAVEETLTADRF